MNPMKKQIIITALLILILAPLSAQSFPFPPELKWWIFEIQKIDSTASVDKFTFSEEKIVYGGNEIDSTYKGRLYPVLKKWNYYGDKFAYHNIMLDLQKEKNGKYSLLGEPESAFAVFDRNETLLLVDFFGSGDWLDSFCWVRDNRIIAVGTDIVDSHENGRADVDFAIYDYQFKDGRAFVKKYTYRKKGISLEGLKLRWVEQRSDYFEVGE
ncbi:MAG: hypothetical protein II921_04640 [Treponema sp.]|nr:hypothetical protein [Treponema sp.]